MNKKLHYSSDRIDWATPPDLFRALDAEFHFDTDVCALPHNAKCQHFITPDDDALSIPWDGFGNVWMNPPYGRGIGAWIERAHRYCNSVCLIPARTETRWWHDYVMDALEIRFIRGRVKFSGSPHNAPFPNAIVIFRPKPKNQTSPNTCAYAMPVKRHCASH